jgi:hypothetical protein
MLLHRGVDQTDVQGLWSAGWAPPLLNTCRLLDQGRGCAAAECASRYYTPLCHQGLLCDLHQIASLPLWGCQPCLAIYDLPVAVAAAAAAGAGSDVDWYPEAAWCRRQLGGWCVYEHRVSV